MSFNTETLDKIYRTCAVCTASANKRCSGCKRVYYCSKQCQSNHWKQHKKECKLSKNKNTNASYSIAHLYLSFVFSIQPWQEIFPLIFICTYGVTEKEINYLFVYAFARLFVQKCFKSMLIGIPNIASCAIPIALNYKSQQPYSNPSITSFRSLYFVYNFVIVTAVWIQWMYLNRNSTTNDLSAVAVKRKHAIIVMFVLGIMYDICNCVIFIFKYVNVSLLCLVHIFIQICGGILMFGLLFGGSWFFEVDYGNMVYNLFLYCLWELNWKEYILCAIMLCVYMLFVYFFGDSFLRINMFSWFKSGMIHTVSGLGIGQMFYSTGLTYYGIIYALYIMYRTWETQKYVESGLIWNDIRFFL